MILTIVRKMMINMIDAIEGTVIMTPDLVEAINSIYDFRVPRKWCYDPTGAEISWLTPSLSGRIKEHIDRHFQLFNWLNKDRPPAGGRAGGGGAGGGGAAGGRGGAGRDGA